MTHPRLLLQASWILGLLLGLGVSACADEPGDTCEVGALGCECFDGSACTGALTCMGNVCVLPDGADTNDEVEPDDDDSTSADDDSTSADDDSTSADEDSTDDSESTDDDPTVDTTGDPCAGPEVMLVSQATDSGDGYGILSGNFADLGGALELADDFTVPASDSCWCITRVVARGFYNMVPLASPTVQAAILDDVAGKPGRTGPWSYVGFPDDDDSGDFSFNVPDTIVGAGTYWINIEPELNYEETIWYWYMETTTHGSPVHMRDADAVFLNQLCTTWTGMPMCNVSLEAGYQASVQFDVFGVVGGPEC